MLKIISKKNSNNIWKRYNTKLKEILKNKSKK